MGEIFISSFSYMQINAFIHCFVAVQRITSLYDLEVAICKNEGVVQFEELELGPLVRHPLVMHYFSVSPDLTEVFKITSEEILSCLCEFTNTQKDKEIKVEEFLGFIAKKRSITGNEKLCVRIQSLGYVVLSATAHFQYTGLIISRFLLLLNRVTVVILVHSCDV